MKNCIFASVLFALMIASPGLANTGAWLTGEELLLACEDEDNDYKQGLCAGYVLGAADGTTIWELWQDLSSNICIASNVKIGRVVDVAVEELRANPRELRFDAASLVLNALIRRFPCD